MNAELLAQPEALKKFLAQDPKAGYQWAFLSILQVDSPCENQIYLHNFIFVKLMCGTL